MPYLLQVGANVPGPLARASEARARDPGLLLSWAVGAARGASYVYTNCAWHNGTPVFFALDQHNIDDTRDAAVSDLGCACAIVLFSVLPGLVSCRATATAIPLAEVPTGSQYIVGDDCTRFKLHFFP